MNFRNRFTFNLFALTILAGVLTPSHSAAERMRDMSLSVEETNRQLRTHKNPTQTSGAGIGYGDGYGNNSGMDARSFGFDENMARQVDEINARYNNWKSTGGGIRLPGTRNTSPTVGHGIGAVGYGTSPSSQPYVKNVPPPPGSASFQGRYMESFCNRTSGSKQNRCTNTQQQQACQRFYSLPNNAKVIVDNSVRCEMGRMRSSQSNCQEWDAQRLALLKQYWQNKDVMYTILFLPDMVINSTVSCTGSTGYGVK